MLNPQSLAQFGKIADFDFDAVVSCNKQVVIYFSFHPPLMSPRVYYCIHLVYSWL